MLVASHPVRVLIVLPSLGGGGAERVVTTLLRHLDRRQVSLTLAVVDLRDSTFSSEVPDDVSIIDLQGTRVRQVVPKLMALIWQLRPNVVFSTAGHLNLAVAMMRFFLPASVRLVAREFIVVSALLEEQPSYRVVAWLGRIFYPLLDAVICQSMDMQKDLVDRHGVPPSKIRLIPNPVDREHILRRAAEGTSKLLHREGVTSLVAMGRLTRQKGFDLLVEAVAGLGRKDIHVAILGKGPEEESLKRQARERGVEAQFRFEGFVDNPYPTLMQADALVLPSRFEGFPNAVLEALACGTPVIATPAPGGVREVLQGVPGCAVATAISSLALAEALRAWLDRPPVRIPPGETTPYDAGAIARQYARVLVDVAR